MKYTTEPALASPKPQDASFASTVVVPTLDEWRSARAQRSTLHPVTHTRHGRNALTPTFS